MMFWIKRAEYVLGALFLLLAWCAPVGFDGVIVRVGWFF